MMLLDYKYHLKQIVYLATDVEQKPRHVVAIIINVNGTVYRLASVTEESEHYEFEISEEVKVY